MELFIPSLLVLILGGIVFAVLLPRFSLHTLGLVSVGLFLLGLYQHWKTFPYEYSMSETRVLLKDYAPFITLLVTILALVGMAMQMSGGSGNSGAALMAALPAMPAMPALPEMPEMPEMPALNIPKMPNIANMGMGRPGNNKGPNANANKNKNLFGINPGGGAVAMNGANNGKRNNIASNSFKIT
jgi:hypothetical protein